MKKIRLSLFCISLIAISFYISSCSMKFYAPTSAITPLLREKGETQISGHIGNGNEIDQSIQFQVASAIDSHIAVFGTLYKAEGGFNKDIENDLNYGMGSQFELGLGYFNKIRKRTSYELYGGIARGQVTNHYANTYHSNTLGSREFQHIIKNKCTKPFIQGNIGYRSKYFDAVFNLRLAYLHIGSISEIFPDIDSSYKSTPVESIDKIKSNPNSFLLEPGFTIRFGYEPLKFQLHLGLSYNSNGDKYPQETGVFSLGFVGMLNSSTSMKK